MFHSITDLFHFGNESFSICLNLSISRPSFLRLSAASRLCFSSLNCSCANSSFFFSSADFLVLMLLLSLEILYLSLLLPLLLLLCVLFLFSSLGILCFYFLLF